MQTASESFRRSICKSHQVTEEASSLGKSSLSLRIYTKYIINLSVSISIAMSSIDC
jgi:hypothetical protein